MTRARDQSIELGNTHRDDTGSNNPDIAATAMMRRSEDSPKSTNSVVLESVHSIPTERIENKRTRKDFGVGLLLLFSVVLLWTGSNFITQDLFEEGFTKPFLVTYLNTASFSIYLLPFLYRLWRAKRKTEGYEPLNADPSTHDADPPSTSNVASPTLIGSAEGLPPLTTRETALLSLQFCLLWFIANWSVNASLEYTSVGSSTVLASTSGLFTLLVGRWLGFETLGWGKVGGVITSFVGVVLVSLADSSKAVPKTNPPPTATTTTLPPPSNPLLGDFLALSSAVFYALYLSLLKVKIKTEERVDMQLFFGFVGLFNIIGLWPLGFLLHVTGIESFEWPAGSKEWTGIAVNMAVTFSSDFIYVLAMLKTTPLVVTLGLTLTIPLAILGDLFLQSRAASLQGILGAMCVVAAFGVIGWEDSRQEQEERALDT